MSTIRPFQTDDLTVPGERRGSDSPEAVAVREENQRKRDARVAEWFSADFWEKVAREVAKLGTWSPDAVQAAYRATVSRPVSASAYPEHGDPVLAALEMVGRWQGVISDPDEERRVALAELEARRVALEAEIASRPKLSPDRPLYVLVDGWDGTLFGMQVRRGDVINVGDVHVKTGRLKELWDRGIIVPAPDHPDDLDVAVALNGRALVMAEARATRAVQDAEDEPTDVGEAVVGPVASRDATPAVPVVTSFGEDEVTVVDVHALIADALRSAEASVADPDPVADPVASRDAETPDERRRRKARERGRRYREKQKATRNAGAKRDGATADVVSRALRIVEDTPALSFRDAVDMARDEIANGGAPVFRASN